MSFVNSSKVLPKLIGVIMILWTIGYAQKQGRVIDKISWHNEPIEVQKLKTKDKPIELAREFVEEDDWLKGLTVTVKNVSNKAIARIELELAFPRPGGGTTEKPTFVDAMIYGLDPADSGAEKVKLIVPGESVDVKLLEVNLPFIKSALKGLGYPEKTTRAQIKVESVTFVDGSMWSGEDIFYPDPSDPKRKINPMRSGITPTSSVPKPQPNPWGLPGGAIVVTFSECKLQQHARPSIIEPR